MSHAPADGSLHPSIAALSAESDFERTFLPFEDKKGVVRAPINRFLDERRRLAADDIVAAAEPESADLSSPKGVCPRVTFDEGSRSD
jgi:hypothetical protein